MDRNIIYFTDKVEYNIKRVYLNEKNIELLSINGKAKLIFTKFRFNREFSGKNVILNQGKNINKLYFIWSKCQICKVSVGDGAFSSSDEAIKLPTKDMKSMYHEVYRKRNRIL